MGRTFLGIRGSDRYCVITTLPLEPEARTHTHNTKGTQAVNTRDAADTAILLPFVDGAVTECRKNVKFMRVQLSISFLDLVTVANC